MIGKLWNIGTKVNDLAHELEFFEALGAEVILREKLPELGAGFEYGLVRLAGTRILMTPAPIFEQKLGHELRPGLTHAVFEVDDLTREYERAGRLGASTLVEPTDASGGFGTRRIAFMQSPNGLVFELAQILTSKVT